MKHAAIYILADRPHGVLYVGVTSDLEKRIYQHKQGEGGGFADKYHCKLLVYYELFENIVNAIEREKQLKAGSRRKKLNLINSVNREWQDFYDDIKK